MYEGYAPGGVAVLIECLTDNRNRAAGEVRTAMGKNGGNMADAGSVAYMFERRGVILVSTTDSTEDAILNAALDAGIEEVNVVGENFVILCQPSDVVEVRSALQTTGIDYESAETPFIASMQVQLDAESAKKVIKLIEALEDCDDVQNVYANFDISDEVMAELE
jgi:YebC/PmpR family DNA-binding regulatory protein